MRDGCSRRPRARARTRPATCWSRLRSSARPPPRSGPSLADFRERLLEIREEIGRILEADLQAHERAASPVSNRTHPFDVRRHHEALVAAPAVAEREEFQRLDEGGRLRLRRRELDREEAGGALEVPSPERVP